MRLPTHDRYGYTPIDQRQVYDRPEGKRLAFHVCTNIDYFALGVGDGALDNASINAKQTHRNYSWRDYGLRVGIWRCSTCSTSSACRPRTTSTA